MYPENLANSFFAKMTFILAQSDIFSYIDFVRNVGICPCAQGIRWKSRKRFSPLACSVRRAAQKTLDGAAAHKHQVAILVFAQGNPGAYQVEIAQRGRHDLAVNNDSESCSL